ncbi:MAG: hypothetical protein HY545_02035 [Candidatus Doudnabacteria bacterium]|nr:hypothetical protein [Candidatus Doudnabacteria bacterium]
MKLNAKINFKVKRVNVPAALTVVLLLILFFEAWIIYAKLYKTIFVEPTSDVTANVVRVNLTQYNQTVDFIRSLENFQAEDLTLPRTNIFK